MEPDAAGAPASPAASRQASRLAAAAGVALVLIGSLVLVGWATGVRTLVQLHSDLAPMQGNAAVGLVLCGLGLVALGARWHRAAVALGLGAALLGAVTFAEYLFGIGFGLDELLFDHYVTTRASHPGRMAPETALAFVLAGFALAAFRVRPAIAGYLATLVLTTGSAWLLAYALGLTAGLVRSAYTQMALHTAIGLMVLGGALLALSLVHQLWPRLRSPWLPFVAGAVLALGTLVLWRALELRAADQVGQTIEVTARGVQREVEDRVGAMIGSLEHLREQGRAARWRSPEEWRTQARLTLSSFPSFVAAHWTDADSRRQTLAVDPEWDPEASASLFADPLFERALERARETSGPVVMGPFLHPAGRLFQVVLPPPEPWVGYLAAAFSADRAFGNLVGRVAPGYRVSIGSDEGRVFAGGAAGPQHVPRWAVTEPLELPGGFDWRLTVAPGIELMAAQRTWLPEGVLLAGLTIALLLTLTLRYGELAEARARDFEGMVRLRTEELVGALERLREENRERRRTETTLRRTQEVVRLVSGELRLERMVQAVTDAATDLAGAAFGAFFYNTVDENGESYTLFTLAGAPREAFSSLPNPHATSLFAPTFRGEGPIRLADVTRDPRFGKTPPFYGLPEGHLPVKSYLAVPVVSRSGEVWGGLFLGHPEPGLFGEREEEIATGLAAQASIAMDNARLYEEERRARGAAQAANAAKDRFLTTLGHELRNPLGSVTAALEVLDGGPGDEATAERMRQILRRQLGHLARLVDDLLDISRIEQGKVALRTDRLDLAGLVREVAESHRAEVEAAGLALDVDLPPGPAWVEADGTRLVQVLGNLVSNSVKFTDPGGRITLALERRDGEAAVRVRDSGCGLAPEEIERIFEPFAQTEEAQRRMAGGLGLGLPIVKGLVEAHGGRLEAASPGLEQGAEFTVRLPAAGPPEAAGADAAPAPDRTGRPLRILVIDDHRDSAEGLAELLRLAGHEVETRFDGPSGLEAAERSTPDVVISDLGLPEPDGFAVARALRAGDGTRTLRLIALSGYGDSAAVERALEAGFDHHLTKPVDPAALRTVLIGTSGRPEAAST